MPLGRQLVQQQRTPGEKQGLQGVDCGAHAGVHLYMFVIEGKVHIKARRAKSSTPAVSFRTLRGGARVDGLGA